MTSQEITFQFDDNTLSVEVAEDGINTEGALFRLNKISLDDQEELGKLRRHINDALTRYQMLLEKYPEAKDGEM